MKKLFTRHNVSIVILLIFIAMTAFICSTSIKEKLYYGEIHYLTEGWEHYGDKKSMISGFQRSITEDMIGQTIVFRAYDSYVDAYVDDDSIYHYGQNVWYLKSPGTAYHFIDIPADALGKTLRIEVNCVYESKYLTEYQFEIGPGGQLVDYHFKAEDARFIITIILVGVGILLGLVCFLELLRGGKDFSALILGILTIGFVIWAGLNGFYFQLLIPNGILRYYVYYFLFYLIPLMIVSYTRSVYPTIKCRFLYVTQLILVTVICVLHFSGKAEFTQTLVPYCVAAMMELIYLAVCYFVQSKNSNKAAFYGFVFWAITIAITAAIYFANTDSGVGVEISEFGLFVYMTINLKEHIKKLIADIVDAKNAMLMKEQAYTDQLTGIGNRRAFDERLHECEPGTVTCFSMDVNYLKYYNDTFGHACGDQLIIATANILTEIFTCVYRTGGDEFVALVDKKAPADLEKLKEQVHHLSEEKSTREMQIQIACGYSNYHLTDQSCEEMVRRADAKMYEDKKELKAKRVIM